MTKTPIRILALDPGTVRMGVALLEGPKLRYHGVKVFTHRSSPQEHLKEVRETVIRLIADYLPDVLAMEKTFVTTNRRFALLTVLSDEITSVARRRRIRVLSLSPSTVKKQVTGHGQAGKEAVAKSVAQLYPELAVFLSQDRKWKARYHSNMFDAVAVGLTALDRL